MGNVQFSRGKSSFVWKLTYLHIDGLGVDAKTSKDYFNANMLHRYQLGMFPKPNILFGKVLIMALKQITNNSALLVRWITGEPKESATLYINLQKKHAISV